MCHKTHNYLKKIACSWTCMLLYTAKLGELILGSKSLAEFPRRRDYIEELQYFPINQHEFKRQRLASKIHIALPICTPVPVHGRPRRRSSLDWALDPRRLHVTAPTHVRDHHHVEIGFPLQGKTNSPFPSTWHPSIQNTWKWNNVYKEKHT